MSGIEVLGNRAANVQQNPVLQGVAGKNKGNGDPGSGSLLFVGNLNLPQAPADKIASARKHAMKLVSDAFDIERGTDKSLSEIREQRTEAESDLTERQDRVARIREGVSKGGEL